MVGLEGLEPPTNGVEIRGTVQLCYRPETLEQATGFKPVSSPWKGEARSLYHTCV